MKKLFLVINEDVFFLSHRKEIALAAKKNGYDVTIVAHNSGKKQEIIDLGLRFIELPINSTGTNIFQELHTFFFLFNLYIKYKPTIIHHVGMKVILWGGLAARFLKNTAVLNAVSGLGSFFNEDKIDTIKPKVIFKILKFIHSKKNCFIVFQNKDDKNIFVNNRIIKDEKCFFIMGSGVNLNEFKFVEEPSTNLIKIVFTGRMVKEKGVLILIEAANLLRERYYGKIQFLLCGGLHNNPYSLKKHELESLCDNSYIKWLGYCNNIKDILKECHLMVFPSYYREGLPKSIIDAEAVGLPVITTNSVGCKDTVIDGYNGYVIPIKDADTLAQKISYLLENSDIRNKMRYNARKFAEENFSLETVINKHLDIYLSIIKKIK